MSRLSPTDVRLLVGGIRSLADLGQLGLSYARYKTQKDRQEKLDKWTEEDREYEKKLRPQREKLLELQVKNAEEASREREVGREPIYLDNYIKNDSGILSPEDLATNIFFRKAMTDPRLAHLRKKDEEDRLYIPRKDWGSVVAFFASVPEMKRVGREKIKVLKRYLEKAGEPEEQQAIKERIAAVQKEIGEYEDGTREIETFPVGNNKAIAYLVVTDRLSGEKRREKIGVVDLRGKEPTLKAVTATKPGARTFTGYLTPAQIVGLQQRGWTVRKQSTSGKGGELSKRDLAKLRADALKYADKRVDRLLKMEGAIEGNPEGLTWSDVEGLRKSYVHDFDKYVLGDEGYYGGLEEDLMESERGLGLQTGEHTRSPSTGTRVIAKKTGEHTRSPSTGTRVIAKKGGRQTFNVIPPSIMRKLATKRAIRSDGVVRIPPESLLGMANLSAPAIPDELRRIVRRRR